MASTYHCEFYLFVRGLYLYAYGFYLWLRLLLFCKVSTCVYDLSLWLLPIYVTSSYLCDSYLYVRGFWFWVVFTYQCGFYLPMWLLSIPVTPTCMCVTFTYAYVCGFYLSVWLCVFYLTVHRSVCLFRKYSVLHRVQLSSFCCNYLGLNNAGTDRSFGIT